MEHPASRPVIRVLFNRFADQGNVNAQTTNAIEVARRLPADRFTSMFFYIDRLDGRLEGLPHLRGIRLPRRGTSLVQAATMLWGSYDVLVYPMPDRGTKLFWALRGLGPRRRTLVSIEGTADSLEAVPRATRRWIRRFAMNASNLTSCSDAVARSLRSRYGWLTTVLPIGVDTSLFRFVDRSHRSGTVRILFVGSLWERKRAHVLLEFMKELRDRDRRVELWIVGEALDDGAYARLLRKKAEVLDSQSIVFLGAVQRFDMPGVMAECDVFVLPSRLEGSPRVLLEASATGLPTVAFRDYDPPSVVDGVTGFLCESDEEMYRRICQLVADRDLRLRMGRAAAMHVAQYDWDLVAPRWEEAILAAASASARPRGWGREARPGVGDR